MLRPTETDARMVGPMDKELDGRPGVLPGYRAARLDACNGRHALRKASMISRQSCHS